MKRTKTCAGNAYEVAAILRRELAFEWGRTDCGSLVRRGLELVFGEPVLELAGYASELEAERTMKQLGEAATFFESQGAASERGSVPRDRRRGRCFRPLGAACARREGIRGVRDLDDEVAVPRPGGKARVLGVLPCTKRLQTGP